ncbi:ABC transporter ATP-binding protein [Fictibacillus sp. KU28468]|uniref:ABC transporter ATP-binding protein n=1 Tax=Fictibacillus sp. KU28468 TaxID=2991053 RepID=UPI00223CFA7B|nr:ABC transporter ATP-binding protein [Fictibacillus sp. KU28468]UZJ80542.1 ABC transporter ATP-binding protein [Fictibacillus sp. KU28468]
MLEIQGVRSGYGDITVLHGVSLNVNLGEIVGILGANGVGKTTLLKTISNLIKTRAGTINYQGKNLTQVPPSKLLNLGIAHVPQGRNIFSKMTVAENLYVGLDNVKKRVNPQEQLDYALELFPKLKERWNQLGGTLSGGEQQMLAIARALVTKPTLLILDEPSMGLAPIIVRSVFNAVKKIAQDGTTILLVEQNAVAALNVIDRLYVMDMGRMVYESQEMNDNELKKIKEVYLGAG